MKLENTIAVGVGVVVIGLGAWYTVSRILHEPPASVTVDSPPKPTAKPADSGVKPSPQGQTASTARPPAIAPRPTLPRPSIMDTASAQTRPTDVFPGPPMGTEPEPRPISPSIDTASLPPAPSVSEPTAASPFADSVPEPKPLIASSATRPAAIEPTLTEPPTFATETVASPSMPSTPTPAPTVVQESKAAREHIVKRGDSFDSLAIHYYGHAKYTKLLQDANPGKDPLRLRPGMKLVVPPGPEPASNTAVAPSPTPAQTPTAVPTTPKSSDLTKSDRSGSATTMKPAPVPPERAYVVKAGDSWEQLAKRFLGNPQDGPELYELNKERVKGHYRTSLRPGVTIELPERANLNALKNATSKPAAQ